MSIAVAEAAAAKAADIICSDVICSDVTMIQWILVRIPVREYIDLTAGQTEKNTLTIASSKLLNAAQNKMATR